MFRQIVSSLSLSPAAAGQLTFYAKRLKQESITRTFSAIAAVLLIGLQFTVITAPSKASNAASPSDLIPGGFQSRTEFMKDYDKSKELRDIYGYFGVMRSDIVNADKKQINSRAEAYNSLGRVWHGKGDEKVVIDNETFWARYLSEFDTGNNVRTGSYYDVLQGYTAVGHRYFAIMFRCGNIVFKTLPPTPKPPTPPKPTPPSPPTPPKPPVVPPKELTCIGLSGSGKGGDVPYTVAFSATASAKNQTIKSYHYNFGDSIKVDSASNTISHTYKTPGTFKATVTVTGSAGTTTAVSAPCSWTTTTTLKPGYTPHKTAYNMTQKTDATKVTANAGDQIEYTLSVKNTGTRAAVYTFSDDITDVLEYADVTTFNGGKLVKDANGLTTITWPQDTIAGGKTVTHKFVVTVKNPIPDTPMSTSDQFSYDLCMDNVFGDSIHICVTPPPAKQIETTSQTLPDTGAGTSTLVILAFVSLVIYFYFRNRQLATEIRILRGDFHGGTQL